MKKIIAATLLASSAPALYAGTVTTACENQQFSLNFSVANNETCTAEQRLTINNSTSSDSYEVFAGDLRAIDLEEGDSATLAIRLSCSNGFGTSTSSTSTGTSDGCVGSASSPENPRAGIPSSAQPPVQMPPFQRPSVISSSPGSLSTTTSSTSSTISNPAVASSPIELLNTLITNVVDDVIRQIESIQSSSLQNPTFIEARLRMVNRMTEIRLNALERQFSDTEAVALIDETRQTLNEMLDII